MKNKNFQIIIIMCILVALLAGCRNQPEIESDEQSISNQNDNYVERVVEYSDDGKKLRETMYDCIDNELTETRRHEYIYNDNNLMSEFYYSYGIKNDDSTITYSYDNSGNLLCKKSKNYKTEYEYDDAGNCLSCYSCDSSGALINSIEYKYQNGILISYKEDHYETDDVERSFYYYEYDYNGRTTKEIICEPGEDPYYTRYQYKENKTIETVYGLDDELYSTSVYEYDANGRLIKYTYYNRDNVLSAKRTFEYNDNMYIKTVYSVEGDSQTIDKYSIFEYDDENRLIKETYYNFENVVELCIEYFFDEYGYEAKEIRTDISGTKTIIIAPIREYNSNGIIIKESFNNGIEYIRDICKATYYDQSKINKDIAF